MDERGVSIERTMDWICVDVDDHTRIYWQRTITNYIYDTDIPMIIMVMLILDIEYQQQIDGCMHGMNGGK